MRSLQRKGALTGATLIVLVWASLAAWPILSTGRSPATLSTGPQGGAVQPTPVGAESVTQHDAELNALRGKQQGRLPDESVPVDPRQPPAPPAELAALQERVKVAGMPSQVAQAIWAASRAYEVPLEIINGVIEVESRWQAGLRHVNRDGSVDYGLMQINERTLPYLARAQGFTDVDPLDPVQNVRMGISHLGYLYDKYRSWHHALTAYNRGEYGLQLYMEQHRTAESAYSQRVLYHSPRAGL